MPTSTRLEKPYTNDPDGRFALVRYGIRDTTPVTTPPRTVEPVTRIVFVLHGIRALTSADWISALGTDIRDVDPTQARIESLRAGEGATIIVHPEYGWLTAAKFAIPFFRQRYLAWFADRFAEILAQHPEAKFFAVAHSNGTYILGQNLLRLSGMEFERVILGGSVLPVDFPWDSLRARAQVSEVRNYRANHDWPVGLLCAGLRALGFDDVGTGGFDGFYGSTVSEVAYLKGGHGAAFESEARRRHIVRYLLLGDSSALADAEKATDPTWFRMLSHFMWYVAWGLVLGAIALGVWVWRGRPAHRRRLLFIVAGLVIVYVVLDII